MPKGKLFNTFYLAFRVSYIIRSRTFSTRFVVKDIESRYREKENEEEVERNKRT
jgi:hypothetical protein